MRPDALARAEVSLWAWLALGLRQLMSMRDALELIERLCGPYGDPDAPDAERIAAHAAAPIGHALWCRLGGGCLDSAMAARVALARRHQRVQVVVGTRRRVRWEAHAWIEAGPAHAPHRWLVTPKDAFRELWRPHTPEARCE